MKKITSDFHKKRYESFFELSKKIFSDLEIKVDQYFSETEKLVDSQYKNLKRRYENA